MGPSLNLLTCSESYWSEPLSLIQLLKWTMSLRVSSLSLTRYSCLLRRAYKVSTFMSELLDLLGTSARLNSSTRIDSCRMRAYSCSIS